MYAHLFGMDASGMTLSNLELAKGLSDLGHSLEVISCWGDTADTLKKHLGFRITFLPKWPFSTMSSIYGTGLLNWIFLPLYSFIIINRINSFKPDIIFVTDETANCFWGVWAYRVATPYVSYCSVPYLKKWKKSFSHPSRFGLTSQINHLLFKFLFNSYRSSKRILAVSSSTKKEIIRGGEVLQPKIHLLPRSIDQRFFSTNKSLQKLGELKDRYKIEPDDFVMFSASRITLNKGIDDVLKAVSNLKPSIQDKVKYIIAGDGPARIYLEKLSEKLSVVERVFFTGSISHQALIPYYDLCDIFILPSRRGSSESFGRVFVEAASRSKPSVGVDDGGMKDIIVEGVTGFLVPPGDQQTIQDRIVSCFLDREKTKRMGENAIARAHEKYTTIKVSRELTRHFNEVLEHR
jgi:glycosyltransferase involved in cell wall biosynthesis